MAKKFRLFRVSLPGDDETSLDRIEFNDPTNANLKNAKVENAWLTSFKRIEPEGVGDDQPAEENLGSLDALGSTEDVYELRGIITNTRGNSDDGQNQFLILLDLWSSEPKKNANFAEGRFGVINDIDHTDDLVPIGTGSSQIGLIWENYEKEHILAKNQTNIVIRFRVSRGDGT